MGRRVERWAPAPQWDRGTEQLKETGHPTATETQEERRECLLTHINQHYFVPTTLGWLPFLKNKNKEVT